jgi:hypothetical protein
MQGLSERTRLIVHKMFPAEEQDEVARLLVEQCGNNLPFLGDLDEVALERFRFAVLKLSGGDFEALPRHIEIAQTDWRDSLVAAGFGHSLTEHERWADDYLR